MVTTAMPVQRWARITGVLLLLSIVAGFLGEFWIPSKLVAAGDAAATARNLASHDLLYRLSFASYLVEAVCDVALALAFYVLLRPVQRELALLAAFFGLVSTAVFAVAELFYFSAPLVLGAGADYLAPFEAAQREALAYLLVRLYAHGSGVFMAFYGAASLLRGWLIFRSTYLPRTLGALLMLAGLGFVARNLLLVLAPAAASDLLLLPMFVAGVSLTAWLLARGVDERRWEAVE